VPSGVDESGPPVESPPQATAKETKAIEKTSRAIERIETSKDSWSDASAPRATDSGMEVQISRVSVC